MALMRLLDLYDAQLRVHDALEADWDGPVFRKSRGPGGGFIGYRSLAGLSSGDIDALIARQRDFFAARGERFEWKHHSHDLPADLPDRLRAHGFVPEDEETVLIGLAADMVSIPAAGVPVRETRDPADFARIAEMKAEVYGHDMSWVPQMLEQETGLRVFVVEFDGRIVSAAWLRFVPGTEFAGLWGGSTLKEYRGRGIYKALVAHRARLAVAEGYKYLNVDASDNSRPILQRLGFEAVTKTTPYIWEPTAA